MTTIDKAKPLRDYNAIILTQLNEICEPLHLLGISNFAYGKITKDRRYFRIGNHERYTDLFYDQNLYDRFSNYRGLTTAETFENPPLYRSFLWNTDAHHFSGEFRLAAGMWNGISFYRTTPDYIESWAFGGTPEDTHLPDFYVNNMELLSKFLNYFKFMGQDIIDLSDKSKTIEILFNDKSDTSLFNTIDPQKLREFNAKILAKRYQINGNQREFNLTLKEIECLIHKSQGLTAKEIAKMWSISPRTVESHINNIRAKSGLQNIHQVIYVCKDSGLL